MNGIIILNKPRGMTSQACVSKIKRILNVKKAGHTGTLDPETTGVLPVCINKATKIIEYLPNHDKEYIAEVTIGISTDTLDFTGNVTDEMKVTEIKDVDIQLMKILKIDSQVPPMFSAVKIDGEKLYKLARKGVEIERKSRPIKIYDIERISEITYNDNCAKFSFRIKGSKGFYVRSICEEIGKLFGYPAHMSKLKRIKAGDFSIDSSYTFEEIENDKFSLLNIQDVLDFNIHEIDEFENFRVRNGNVIKNRFGITDKSLLTYQGEVLAIYEPHKSKEGLVKPIKVL